MAKGFESAMKAKGRNLAKADQQKSSKKVPFAFARGGPVLTGGGTMRGGGAATKGKKFSGSC